MEQVGKDLESAGKDVQEWFEQAGYNIEDPDFWTKVSNDVDAWTKQASDELSYDPNAIHYEYLLSNYWSELDGAENFTDYTKEVFQDLDHDRRGLMNVFSATVLDLEIRMSDILGNHGISGLYSGDARMVGGDYTPDGYAEGDVIPHGYGIFRITTPCWNIWQCG